MAARITRQIGRNQGAENANADEAGSERRAGGRFCGARRLQVVVGELGGAVDRNGASVRLDQMPQGPGAGREGVGHASNPR